MRDLEEAVARAIEKCCGGFRRPVHFYVEGEALDRYEAANPDWHFDDIQNKDWALESWKIIARAALAEAGEYLGETTGNNPIEGA
jgi:hypothetical protein